MSRRVASAYVIALLAAVAVLAVVIARWSLMAGVSVLADYALLAVVCAAIATAMAGAGLWVVWRKVPWRPLRVLGGCAVVGLGAALAGGMLFAWGGSDAQGRYNRAFGGPGRCLDGTPYAAFNVTIVHLPDLPEQAATKTQPARAAVYNRFAARPADLPRDAELRMRATKSGNRLLPEDKHSTDLLGQHGCHW
ncbi:hypothetical protein [Streptomyces sp. NPDC002221]|uniref:hypothetical protein n=1 Tax=Streptomyces sp. NPDC002221 TaxID=3364639 RepID=UPI0036A0A935